MNTVCLSGTLTKNPELKTTTDGREVCSFRIAVKRPGTKDKTDFFTCVAWNQKALFVSRYFEKGSRIEVTGCLTTNEYDDKTGVHRATVEISCSDIGFGGNKKSSKNNPSHNNEIEEDDDDDDLPF